MKNNKSRKKLQSWLLLIILSVLITLLTGFRKSTWRTPYPDLVLEPGTPTEKISLGTGGGYPMLWWRTMPGLDPGQLHMTALIQGAFSFVIDILFWLIILLLCRFIFKKSIRVDQ